ncbi:hypothetical protein GC177_00490 [bacterium]|nr:hypothetical protein [bacterium]
MQPDIEEYRQYVDRFDLSEEQKIELIRTIWLMMQSFVDTAFGYHPVQLCLKQDLQAIPSEIESHNNQLSKSFSASAEGE